MLHFKTPRTAIDSSDAWGSVFLFRRGAFYMLPCGHKVKFQKSGREDPSPTEREYYTFVGEGF